MVLEQARPKMQLPRFLKMEMETGLKQSALDTGGESKQKIQVLQSATKRPWKQREERSSSVMPGANALTASHLTTEWRPVQIAPDVGVASISDTEQQAAHRLRSSPLPPPGSPLPPPGSTTSLPNPSLTHLGAKTKLPTNIPARGASSRWSRAWGHAWHILVTRLRGRGVSFASWQRLERSGGRGMIW